MKSSIIAADRSDASSSLKIRSSRAATGIGFGTSTKLVPTRPNRRRALESTPSRTHRTSSRPATNEVVPIPFNTSATDTQSPKKRICSRIKASMSITTDHAPRMPRTQPEMQGNTPCLRRIDDQPQHNASDVPNFAWISERRRIDGLRLLSDDLATQARRRTGLEELVRVRTRPHRCFRRGEVGVDETRLTYDNPVRKRRSCRRRRDIRGPRTCLVSATAASHCKNEPHHRQTHRHATYPHHYSPSCRLKPPVQDHHPTHNASPNPETTPRPCEHDRPH